MAVALDKIKDMPEYRGGHHLFHGEFLLHQCKYAEAADEFGKILSLPETTEATRQWIEQLKLELRVAAPAASPPASGGAKGQ